MGIYLREMFPSELAAFRSYSVQDYAHDLMQEQKTDKASALVQAGQEFDALLPGSFLRVITNDDCAVGVLWYLIEETDGVHHVFLNDLIISPSHRRKGYASTALTALALEACQRGCTEIRLYVSDDNKAARALYERCGFHLLRPFGAGAYLHKEIG